VSVNRPYARNGLNQYTSAGGAAFTYDANGNLTSDGTTGYGYDIENRLVGPVMEGQGGHRGVDAVVGKGQGVGACPDRRGGVGAALADHFDRGFDCDDLTIRRFV
jgi:hypothetical protein